MGLRDRMYELVSVEEVDEFLQRFPTGAFFKAGGCHKTMQGFGYAEEALNPRENIHLGFVRVIESRPVSNYIAEITQVVHQSPQLILMIDGKPVYDVDNWDITPQALHEAFQKWLGPVPVSQAAPEGGGRVTEVTPYLQLLQQFLGGQITELDFRQKWLMTFQSDAAPRSTEEFTLLNSLFGDVDAAISLGTSPESADLKSRAEKLYSRLQA